MKVVIVNCFETNENRVQILCDFFEKNEDDVIVIQSDFKHISKSHRKDKIDKHVFIKSNPYHKNLSIDRLISHHKFSKDAMATVEKENPDLLYVIFPPNSLAKFAAKYKRNNPKVKLVFDIMDLWPETMPIGKAKSFPPFMIWGAMRDKSLKYADFVITECNLYQTVLDNVLKEVKTETVYLAKKEIDIVSNTQINEDEVHLVYLGSINNIIDIPKIKEIIQAIKDIKPVTLHIIGDGEKKQELIDEAKAAGAVIEYHGKIYDPQEKQRIFDRCHFGLNIMKKSVCVGLTMKSIDYFQHGIPILNNIKSDTYEIVEKFNVGFNIVDNLLHETIASIVILSNYEIFEMKERTYSLFSLLFSTSAFELKLHKIMREI